MASLSTVSRVIFSCFLFGFFVDDNKGMQLDENLLGGGKGDFHNRGARLIKFDTDSGNVKLDLQFSTSFLEIPVKPSLDFTRSALTKINVGALVLTGIVTFASAVVFPLLLSFIKQKFMSPFITQDGLPTCQSPYRGSEQESDLWRHLTALDNALLENNIDMTSCVQRMLCSSVRKAASNIEHGRGTSTDKIIDGIATNEWLLTFIDNSPISTSVRNGLSNVTCFEEYSNCKISKRAVNTFLKRSGKLLSSWFD